MKLLIIRHAKAENTGPTGRDSDRPLSSNGRSEFEKTLKNLSFTIGDVKLKVDLLLNSPLLRSKQTADMFVQYFPVQKRLTSENLNPLSFSKDLLKEMQDHGAGFVTIVGHQPFLKGFISYLVAGDESLNIVFLQRGCWALLDVPDGGQAGCAFLLAMCNF